MAAMTYDEAMAYLAALAPRGWRLGLDRMAAFADAAGLTPFLGASGSPRYIHVAGTNGKGSTTAFVQSILVEAGFRTGAFFSPYVVDPRERWQCGRELISEDAFAAVATHLREVADRFGESDYGGITEFEMKAAIGFEFWRRMDCEYVALEVGLGGRLDATNIVTPAVSVVVSIGLDHMHILGDTEGQIAVEKAGIVKLGVPVVIGQMSEEARNVIEDIADARGSQVLAYGENFSIEGGTFRGGDITFDMPTPGLTGPVQAHNAAVAAAACVAAGVRDTKAIIRGIERAHAPGRFEVHTYRGRETVFDGAHNGPAARKLAEAMAARYPGRSVRLVTGMLTGHDPLDFIRPFGDALAKLYVAPINFYRARKVEDLAQEFGRQGYPVAEFESVPAALDAAVAESEPDDVLLVSGSNYLVGDALAFISARK